MMNRSISVFQSIVLAYVVCAYIDCGSRLQQTFSFPSLPIPIRNEQPNFTADRMSHDSTACQAEKEREREIEEKPKDRRRETHDNCGGGCARIARDDHTSAVCSISDITRFTSDFSICLHGKRVVIVCEIKTYHELSALHDRVPSTPVPSEESTFRFGTFIFFLFKKLFHTHRGRPGVQSCTSTRVTAPFSKPRAHAYFVRRLGRFRTRDSVANGRG